MSYVLLLVFMLRHVVFIISKNNNSAEAPVTVFACIEAMKCSITLACSTS